MEQNLQNFQAKLITQYNTPIKKLNNNNTIRAVHITTAQHTKYSFSATTQATQHNTINTYLLNIISLFVQMI